MPHRPSRLSVRSASGAEHRTSIFPIPLLSIIIHPQVPTLDRHRKVVSKRIISLQSKERKKKVGGTRAIHRPAVIYFLVNYGTRISYLSHSTPPPPTLPYLYLKPSNALRFVNSPILPTTYDSAEAKLSQILR